MPDHIPLKPIMTGVLHVASLLVQVQPDQVEAVASWLRAQPGTEVPVTNPEGKVICVIERTSERQIADLTQTLADTPGVLSASLVYHEILDPSQADQLQEERPCS